MIATFDARHERRPGCGVDKKVAAVRSLGVTYGLVLAQASDFDAFAAGAATSRALAPDSGGQVVFKHADTSSLCQPSSLAACSIKAMDSLLSRASARKESNASLCVSTSGTLSMSRAPARFST
jgi:hypothetical protein